MALNTPHARRHIKRLVRKGFTFEYHGDAVFLARGAVTYSGTSAAQVIALAAGRRQAMSGECGGTWEDWRMYTSRRKGRGRAEANRAARLAAEEARWAALDAAAGRDRDLE